MKVTILLQPILSTILSAPKTLYRICDAVARQNGNALHLIVRGREDKSVGFIVLIVAEES